MIHSNLSIDITREQIKKAYEDGSKARNGLTATLLKKDCHGHFTHVQKVCCVCDRLVKYGDEKWLDITKFSNGILQRMFLRPSDNQNNIYGLHIRAFRSLKMQYQQNYFKLEDFDGVNDEESYESVETVNKMILSPRSYGKVKGTKKYLGCCKECYNFIMMALRPDTEYKGPPKFAICNGLMIGSAPQVLSKLNEVEMAMISLAKSEKHIFSYSAGAHKEITGWHTMYANDVEYTNKVMNYFHQQQEQRDEQESSNRDVNDNRYRLGIPGTNCNSRHKKLSNISVILTGHWTTIQTALGKKRTQVDIQNIRHALTWLRANNVLYKDFDFDETALPFVVDCHQVTNSSNSNIETVFEMNSVFSDNVEPLSINGGYKTVEEFTKSTLGKLMTAASQRQTTLIAKSSPNRLKDYLGENLLKAFPLQFPYGIGSKDSKMEERCGTTYLQYLLNLSRPDFQKPDFVVVIHNIWERKNMIKSSYIKVSNLQKNSIGDITNEEIDGAVHRYLSGQPGNATSDMFLSKLEAITGSLAYSKHAAKNARHKMFAMIGRFGLPSILFTITPDDNFNFRIKIMSHEKGGCKNPPDPLASDTLLKEFVIDCAETRVNYPGLCAFDYQNVIAITIHILLGWDTNKQQNIENNGLFGNLSSWCYATEEQGRKTLHAHFLLWVRNWSVVLDNLRDLSRRPLIKRMLEKYAKTIMRAKFLSMDKPICDCGNQIHTLKKCTNQDLRNLRHQEGTTSFGDKSMFWCSVCNKGLSGNQIIVSRVDKEFGNNLNGDTNSNNSDNFFDERALWFGENKKSKRKAQMALEIIKSQLSEKKHGKVNPFGSNKYRKTDFFTTAMRNIHNSDHCGACFKKGDKCKECRMKIPQKECSKSQITFNSDLTPWYTWEGEFIQRNLFIHENERDHIDSYVNIHNEIASVIFGCNTNVVSCVDGGSVMYVTSYVSKSTKIDDKQAFVKAATHMISNLRKRIEALNSEMDTCQHTREEDDKLRDGINVLIGASLMSTSSYRCSSTMAAFLTRNHSRFQFSHDFTYTNLNDFYEAQEQDYTVDSNDNGTMFFKSRVANYIHREQKYKNVSLYDFISLYTIRKVSDNDMTELYNYSNRNRHSSQKYIKVKKKKGDRFCIPTISYFEFPDTKCFGGNNIRTCNLLTCSNDECDAMEVYARKASILFIPFTDINELQDDHGKFLPRLRQFLTDPPDRFVNFHQTILKNMQDCRNSMNAGRPKDALETITTPFSAQSNCNGVDNEEEEQFDYTYEEFLIHLEQMQRDVVSNITSDTTDTTDMKLSVNSAILRDCGGKNCGRKLLVGPSIPSTTTICIEKGTISANSTSLGNNKNKQSRRHYIDRGKNGIYILHTQYAERKTTNTHSYWIDENIPNGRIDNIIAYGKSAFNNDKHQTEAFYLIVTAFVKKLYSILFMRETIIRRDISIFLREFNNIHPKQFIGFLSGPGGTGKSKVIHSVLEYCKGFCSLIDYPFDKRTIVVTALTGSAAVNIGGETTHSACLINKKIIQATDIEDWQDTALVIIDEISFASYDLLKKIDSNLNFLQQTNQIDKFGELPILFAGDFTQLEPVNANPIWLDKNNTIWYDYVNIYMELKTNHRFNQDRHWGKMLQKLRVEGLNQHEIDTINERVVSNINSLHESQIPSDAVYATKDNRDKTAINDGIFSLHISQTHSKDKEYPIPKHTICIKASNISFKMSNRHGDYTVDRQQHAENIIYSCCGDCHVKDGSEKRHDPMLKLYYDRPLCINQNLDVGNCIANGAMCKFKGIVLKEGFQPETAFTPILYDGYHVNTVDASLVQYLVVEMIDGNNANKKVTLKAENVSGAKVQFPFAWDNPAVITKKTKRINRIIRFSQFPVNVANARTVHKLQGRSLTSVVISTFDYTGNWVYVVLSRCATLGGLFLRKKLLKTKPMSALCSNFHHLFSMTKQPCSLARQYFNEFFS